MIEENKSVFVVHHKYEHLNHQDTKFIGVFSSEINAIIAVKRMKNLPGFEKYKNGFSITEHSINQEHWLEGFG
jgi:hypothetical protein